MILSSKTLECLREMINVKTEYRKGVQLIEFFNKLGFNDIYQQGFPSRWQYTDQKLQMINGTPQLDACIKQLFAPINFVGRISDLDSNLKEFNQYLAFDKWRVVRDSAEISFKRLDKIEIDEASQTGVDSENNFLNREFSNIPIHKLGLEGPVVTVLEQRVKEIEKCFSASAHLASILLAGSTLEGILLGLATTHPMPFNKTNASPKNRDNKVKPFQDWSLSNFIDVAKELSLIQHDTYKFAHTLRDFRNYIHPFEQMASGFSPREHTSKICLQVLKAAIHDLHSSVGKLECMNGDK